MTIKQEVRAFTMAPELLHSVISSQCGTPGKAILEGCMNSIDAGATKVTIDVDEKGYRITDDGHGFVSKQTIIDFFGTFGTKHEEGDARFGTYRMGRGQGFSFGINQWRTGQFEMSVDIKGKGLDYQLTELPLEHAVSGCYITVTWYTKPLPSELESIHREFKELAAFAEIPVIYNGKQINKLPQNEKWDIVTDEAYIKLRETGGLSVYNLGVLVRTYPAYQFGTGGVVVSRNQLKVNFARNDILLNKCEEWKKISKTIKTLSGQNISQKKTRMNEDERIALGRMLLAGETSMRDIVSEAKLITNAKGAHLTIESMLSQSYKNGFAISFAPSGNQVAEMLHNRGLAFILSENTFSRFDATTPEEFFEAIIKITKLDGPNYWTNQAMSLRDAYVPFLVLKEQVLDTHTVIPDKELTVKEKALMPVVANLNYSVSSVVRYLTGHSLETRNLRIGTSDVAEAWTDGKNYIALHRKLLEEIYQGGYKGLFRVAGILVHEYLHNSTDQGSHIHDHEFYELWHEVMLAPTDGPNIGRAVDNTMSNMVKVLKELDKKLPRSLVTALDNMAKTHTTPMEESVVGVENDDSTQTKVQLPLNQSIPSKFAISRL